MIPVEIEELAEFKDSGGSQRGLADLGEVSKLLGYSLGRETRYPRVVGPGIVHEDERRGGHRIDVRANSGGDAESRPGAGVELRLEYAQGFESDWRRTRQ